MNLESRRHRRSFLGGMFGTVAIASLPSAGTRAAQAEESGTDDWIKEV